MGDFNMEHRSAALITSWFTAIACQVREVRVLEETGVSPHHSGSDEAETVFPSVGREGTSVPPAPAITHCGLCTTASLLGLSTVSEHG